MLLSMTGFGEAQSQRDGLRVSVEVRTTNNRYLKLTTHTSDGYAALEAPIEALVRKRIRRGTVQVTVRIDRACSADDYCINVEVLANYRRQLDQMRDEWHQDRPVPLESLLLLPGVVSENPSAARHVTEDWPLVRDTLEAAIHQMQRMRQEEGRAMADDLKANARLVAASLEEVQRRAPLVAEAYRGRLAERVEKALAALHVTLDPADLLREVSLFSERSDISEEVVRLRSHLEQFDELLDSPESAGRKLEFLVQEMVREANTIGSKANDIEIVRRVIEMKAAIERMREMIQNVE